MRTPKNNGRASSVKNIKKNNKKKTRRRRRCNNKPHEIHYLPTT